MNTRFILMFLLIILLTLCKKKTLPVSNLPLPPSLEIGNMKGMNIKTLNATFQFAFQISPAFDLDINDDGVNDVKYWIYRSGTAGSGYAMVQSMELINNKISFMGASYNESSFLHFDTLFTNDGSGKVWKRMSKKYYFARQSSSDSVILNYYSFKTKAMKQGESLNQSDSFGDAKTDLLNWNVDHTNCPIQSTDTTYCNTDNLNLNIHPYPMNEENYFGFRLNDGGVYRLGWLKFIIPDEYTVKFLETAIQKN